MADDDEIEVQFFTGHCTCDHIQSDHGWMGCDIDDCNCTAHWEE